MKRTWEKAQTSTEAAHFLLVIAQAIAAPPLKLMSLKGVVSMVTLGSDYDPLAMNSTTSI